MFQGWVDKMKARFRDQPPPAPQAPLAARQASADVTPEAPAKRKT
jgi:hypothetical protein